MTDVSSTFGALLLGALVAVCLSGVVTVQTFVYMKLYPNDTRSKKSMVGVVWSLDTLHSSFVCASLWYYFISHFGDAGGADHIPWCLAITIAITAVLTFLVHCFFVHRIFRLTNNSWYLAAPIAVLAFLRLLAACVTTAEMIRIKTFSGFAAQFQWVFTLGLALSSVVDIGITAALIWKLRTSRTTNSSMNAILDSLVVYTMENGSLTSAATVVAMICWLTMPHNRIFIAIHFVIAKLYANSLLATLITRKQLQRSRKSIINQLRGELPHPQSPDSPVSPQYIGPEGRVIFPGEFDDRDVNVGSGKFGGSGKKLLWGRRSEGSRVVSFQSFGSKKAGRRQGSLQISIQKEFETTMDELEGDGDDSAQPSPMLPPPTLLLPVKESISMDRDRKGGRGYSLDHGSAV